MFKKVVLFSVASAGMMVGAENNYSVISRMDEAKSILLEEEVETSIAEQRVEAKLFVAYGGNKDDMVKPRASKIHDRVTFVIEDDTETSLEAKTELTSSNDTKFNLQNWFTIDRNENGDIALKPYSMSREDGDITQTSSGDDRTSQVLFNSENEHEGEGKTNRKNSFKTKLSGQVIEVLPNSHLVVEAKKIIHINGETQTVTLVGIVDPNDLNDSSEVEGERIIDLRVTMTGKGEVTDAVRPGWLSKLINKFKPI